MRFTEAQYQEYLAKHANAYQGRAKANIEKHEHKESHLHDQIIAYCNAQWPRWKYIRARMDKRSTIGVGVHDITIFADDGKVFLIECKRPKQKLTQEQCVWVRELAKLGHTVHTVHDFDEFLKVVQ